MTCCCHKYSRKGRGLIAGKTSIEGNVLPAFDWDIAAITDVLSALTHKQRCTTISCVKEVVNRFIACNKGYGHQSIFLVAVAMQ